MKVDVSPDVIPGSIWYSTNGLKFIVTSVESGPGQKYWVNYYMMGTTQQYRCLVEAFQQRFSLYINHNFQGSIWKLSSI